MAAGTTLAACMALALAGAAVAAGAGAPAAGAAQQRHPDTDSVIFSDTFEQATASSVTLPPPSTGAGNIACLTASGNTSATPVPGCVSGTPIDAPGSGALRLTGVQGSSTGGAFADTAFPMTGGLDLTFDAYQYDAGTGGAGDGLAFELAAVNPSDPVPPADIGSDAGALGYAPASSAGGTASRAHGGGATTTRESGASRGRSVTEGAGLADGYLGVGLDVGGDFTDTAFDGSGCTNPKWAQDKVLPENVTVRGPGNGTSGYCLLDSSAATVNLGHTTSVFALDDPTATTRSQATAVPVEVALNPTGSTLTTPSGLKVGGGSYTVKVGVIGKKPVVLSAPLPSTTNGKIPPDLYPSSWIGTFGVPSYLALGWTASTGSLSEIHEVTLANATTLPASTGPQLEVGTTVEYASEVSGDQELETWQFPVGLAAGTESGAITARITLPKGTKIIAAGGGAASDPSAAPGSFWICGPETAGYDVTCRTSGGPFTPTSGPPFLFVTGQFPIPSARSAAASALRPRVTPAAAGISVSAPGAVGGHGRGSIHGKQPPRPSGMKVLPGLGPTAGGNSVVVSGRHLSAATAVAIGGAVALACPAPSHQPCFRLDRGKIHIVHVPPGPPGSVPLIVVTRGESGSTSYRYREGFWVVARDGGVFTFGSAAFHGSLGGKKLASPVVGMAAAPWQDGYWIAEADGTVKRFGAARSFGSVPARHLSGKVVGIASLPDGEGYWLATSTGEVYPFGAAGRFASTGGRLTGTVVGIASTPDGRGYWLVTSRGQVFARGDARSYGRVRSGLHGTVVGLAPTPNGRGYFIASSTGQVWHFGNAPAVTPKAGTSFPKAVAAIAATPDGKGFWLLVPSGLSASGYGDAANFVVRLKHPLVAPVVSICTT